MTVYETTNHNTIYHWATSQGLYPACVAGEPTKIRLGGDPDANLGELQPGWTIDRAQPRRVPVPAIGLQEAENTSRRCSRPQLSHLLVIYAVLASPLGSIAQICDTRL